MTIFTELELKEIAELEKSEAVKLARRAEREKYKAKQKLYTLRWLKKQGERLLEQS